MQKMNTLGKKLRFVFPHSRVRKSNAVVPCEYTLRNFKPEDSKSLLELMNSLGWNQWDTEYLHHWRSRALPNGWFVISSGAKNEVAACCIAAKPPKGQLGGELAWLAVHPDHRRLRLGTLLAENVTQRLLAENAHPIFLTTEGFRTAAIRIYTTIGYEPDLQDANTNSKWGRIQRLI